MTTKAQQAILLDTETGAILFEKNADERMPTSSMSKALSMYVVFEALKESRLKLDDTVRVSDKAWRKGGSKMFIEVGKKVKVEDLIQGVIVQSGNDATIALAEAVGGTEEGFTEILNHKAREFGMTNSHFTNASGWPDPEHYSTARDLAILAYHVIYDFPEYHHYWAEKEFTYNGIKQHNRNLLLFRNMGVDGLKTGHTEDAGYGLMATAKRGDRRLIAITNGLTSERERADETARLLEWGFAAFENLTLYKKGDTVHTADVWLGEPQTIPLVIDQTARITIPKLKKDEMNVTISYQEPLPAPVRAGETIGKLVIEIPGLKNREYDLKAGATAEKLGLIPRTLAKANYFLMGAQ